MTTRLAVTVLTTLGITAVVKVLNAPRNEFGSDQPTPRPPPPRSLARLDAWLAASESTVNNLRSGLAKGIVWHKPEAQRHHRTPWSVVYIHGFSASRLETTPLAERIAEGLGANLFYTRLAGHGCDGDAMGKATVQDWLADMDEAARIGHLLGEKVLIMGASTGATLATWYALHPEGRRVAAYVFLSPNFGMRNKRANIINAPWGRQIALAIQGPTVKSARKSPSELAAWTTSYPTEAVFPVMAMVKKISDSNLALFNRPVMMMYSDQDERVAPACIKAAFSRIGSPVKYLKRIRFSIAEGQHVLAGDIMDPRATRPMADAVLRWIREAHL
jgi:alpha-beta hydrolase superfamily lysophospholipase